MINKILTTQEVKEFNTITKEAMKLDLTKAGAEDQRSRLITFFELLIKIDRKNK